MADIAYDAEQGDGNKNIPIFSPPVSFSNDSSVVTSNQQIEKKIMKIFF